MALFLFFKSAHSMQYELKQLSKLILHLNLLKVLRDRSTILYSDPPINCLFYFNKAIADFRITDKKMLFPSVTTGTNAQVVGFST